jgi:hypothetical protein
VFAAGNENGPVGYPATLSEVIAVSATSPCDERKSPSSCDGESWWGSSYGPEIDVSAPGVFHYSTDIMGAAGYSSGNYYSAFNGTSSACPVVAGVVALILSMNPTYTPDQVQSKLQDSADDLGPPGFDNEFGYGRVNAYNAIGAQINLQTPLNGAVFDSSSLITKYQPSFSWTESGTITKCTILFSTSSTDFATPIAKGSASGAKDSWTPSISIWKKLMSASNNSGVIRNIYWKVIGTLPNRPTVESEVWGFRIGDPQAVTINSPTDGAILPSGVLPIFAWQTKGNVKFKLEISSLGDFSDSKKIKNFNYTTRDPNVETTLSKTLPSFQWNAVKKLIGAGQGYFRIKAWDGLNRETVSEIRSFTIQ